MKRIHDIATIRLGSPFRERIVHEPTGKFLVVQGKDVGSDGSLVLEGMARVADVPGKGVPDTLAAGELVFQTRGLSYRAAAVPNEAPSMVAAGSLFILRPDPSRVTADYLVFFLNLPVTQAVLRQLATGSTIPNLRRSAIEQLALPLPSLSDQHRLVALSRLVRQQADIETRLNALRLQELHLLAAARAGSARGSVSRSSVAKTVPAKSCDNAISQR
jgi:Type I restriction modification DNA specificity domain